MNMKMKVYKSQKIAAKKVHGSGLLGHINGTFKDIVKVLGDPTFSKESKDRRRQKTWVIKYGDEVFSLYDWGSSHASTRTQGLTGPAWHRFRGIRRIRWIRWDPVENSRRLVFCAQAR